MATFEDLRVMVREKLSLTDTTDASTVPGLVELKRLINNTRYSLYREMAAFFPERLDQQTTMTYTGGADSVALPSAVQKRIVTVVQALQDSASTPTDRYDLRPKAIHELDDYEATGTPAVYALDWGSNLMRVRPIPSANTTLYLRYVPALTVLVANGDLPSEWPVEFHEIIADGAAAAWLGKNGDAEASKPAENYADGVITLRKFLDVVFPDTHIQSRAQRR